VCREGFDAFAENERQIMDDRRADILNRSFVPLAAKAAQKNMRFGGDIRISQ